MKARIHLFPSQTRRGVSALKMVFLGRRIQTTLNNREPTSPRRLFEQKVEGGV